MLKELKWESLSKRRGDRRLECLFLINSKKGGWSDLSSNLKPANFIGYADHQFKLDPIRALSNTYLYFFLPKTIKEWNGLSKELFKLPPNSLGDFRRKLSLSISR